jgi:hypothetical protein
VRAAIVALMLAGCGGSSWQVPAESARAAACEGAEEAVEQAHARGDITDDEARAVLGCQRAICDRLHGAIVGDDE